MFNFNSYKIIEYLISMFNIDTYKFAIYLIRRAYENDRKIDKELKKLPRLTYHSYNEKTREYDIAHLTYGLEAEWENFGRYEVIHNAIQKLADYEDREENLRKGNPND